MPPAQKTILLRFSGEIATKAKPTRTRFEARLLRNVKDALRAAGVAAPISRTRNRVFVDTRDARAADVLSRVFGVQSLAVATVHPAEKLDELDTTSVLPTTHALAVSNAFREDELGRSLTQQEALANGPLQNGEAFVVPKVI